MPVPEGRMRATLILPQHLIREMLAPLAKDGGGPIPSLRALQARKLRVPDQRGANKE
jgi:hypothetical protein